MSQSAAVGDGPVVGVGLAAVGRPAYITPGRDRDLGRSRSVEELEADARSVLDAAYAAGVRYVDAARSYGLAERFLGGWLSTRADRLGSADVTVASKWGYAYVGGWRLDAEVHEVKDHSLDAFERQVEETRAALGRLPDVYQVHSLTPDSPALTDAALHRRLAGLRDGGTAVGFSTSGPRQADVVRRALTLEVGGARLFAVVQSTWNVLEPSAGPALAEARRAGLRVVVKEAVANGRLVGVEADPAPGVAAVLRLAGQLGVTPDQVAVAAALAQPWASVVLSGAVTPDQLRSNLGAARVDLPPGWLDDVLAAREQPEAYWRERSARAWT
ncbi:Predicted oxidoreductase [Microlunatus sagamiharensis]|uniref:Predicted oxidoreductase n=1 Tax=Microlunatus sagamiharensis TaxID=546874 RepID=A0A1H2MUI9_9ACTN|nr:aldo/keto reductase [Microlunatus sagamiharensis]SDU96628.1 Predicted oxidoreductase [Microlunatus sagamiharensis]